MHKTAVLKKRFINFEAFIISKGFVMSSLKTIKIDGLDSSTVLHLIQAAYKHGYNQINVEFTDRNIIRFREGITKDIDVLIEQTIRRLYGMKIKNSEENLIELEYNGSTEFGTIDKVLKKIFDTLLTFSEEVLIRSKQDVSVFDSARERRNELTKFISLCLRLINVLESTNAPLYHILSALGRIVNVLKYTSKRLKESDDKSIYELAEKTNRCIALFKDYFYDSSNKKLFFEFSQQRKGLGNLMNQNHYSSEDMEILTQWVSITDELLECFEATSIFG